MSTPLLSVVIPTLNEADTIGGLLGDLRGLGVAHEVVVADGGSTDATLAMVRAAGGIMVPSPRGRGRQLRAGVAASRAPMLCVLHADVRLPPETVRAIETLAAAARPVAYAFRLRVDASGLSYRLVELAANVRSRVLGLPYGDQGLLLHRNRYDAAGGYADVPLMEDVLLVRALGPTGGVWLRREPVIASARRWERDGVLRRSIANLAILARFMAGASPEELASRYTS